MDLYCNQERNPTESYKCVATLDKGRPLIVALKPVALKPASGGALHYVVVTGLGSEMVMVNDPAQRKLLQQDRPSFEREWSAAGKWTLLVLPQTQPR